MRRLLNRRESFLSREKTPLIVPFILQIIKKTTNHIPSLYPFKRKQISTEVRNVDQDQDQNKISREKFENLERNSSTSTTTNLTI